MLDGGIAFTSAESVIAQPLVVPCSNFRVLDPMHHNHVITSSLYMSLLKNLLGRSLYDSPVQLSVLAAGHHKLVHLVVVRAAGFSLYSLLPSIIQTP